MGGSRSVRGVDDNVTMSSTPKGERAHAPTAAAVAAVASTSLRAAGESEGNLVILRETHWPGCILVVPCTYVCVCVLVNKIGWGEKKARKRLLRT